MTITPVNIGAAPNDGTGDPNRTAFAKLNNSVADLVSRISSLTGLSLTAGTITMLPYGSTPTFSLTGTAPGYQLNMGIPEGPPGAGAPTSADILAIAERSDLISQIAFAGVPDSPSLVLDFIRGTHWARKAALTASILTLVAALSGVSAFTRASTATYWDSDGLLKTAANNIPRIEYDPLTRLSRGLLIENLPRTNSVINNVSLSSSTQSNVARTANTAISPDGSTTMSRFTSTVNGGTNTCATDMLISVPNDALTRTFSGFIRQGNTPQSTINFYYSGGTFVQVVATINWSTKTISGGGSPTLVDCGGGLYQFSVTLANNASGNTQAVCRVYVRDQGTSNVIGDYVDTGTWQLEDGATMSSPIITGASAVTRAADQFLLSGGAWLPSTGPLSAVVECRLNEKRSSGVSDIFFATMSTNFNTVRLREGAAISNAADFFTASGNVAQITSAQYSTALQTTMRFAFGFDASSYILAKDNIGTATGGSSTLPVGLDRLAIGASGFMGHVRRVIVWPQRLSNTKVQALSNQAAWQ